MREKDPICIEGESHKGRLREPADIVNVNNEQKKAKYGTFQYTRQGMPWGREISKASNSRWVQIVR